MNMSRFVVAAVAVLLLTPLATTHAEVVFNDTFDIPSGGSATTGNDAADPNDVAWSVYQGGSLSVVGPDTRFGTAYALQFDAGGTWRGVQSTGFAAQVLEIGKGVKFSVDFRYMGSSGSVPDSSSGLRIGLYGGNSYAKGYYGTLGSGDNGGSWLLYDTGSDTTYCGGTTEAVTSTASGTYNGADAGEVIHLSLTLTRTGTDTHSLVVRAEEGANVMTRSANVGSGQYFNSFGRVILRNNGSVSSWFRVDNAKLEIVPEPATIGLLSLGFVGLAALRRRRK